MPAANLSKEILDLQKMLNEVPLTNSFENNISQILQSQAIHTQALQTSE